MFAPVRLSTSFSISLSTWASSTCRAVIFGFAFAAFFFSCQRLVACQLLYHLLINNRFQFRSDDFPTARTAFIVQPFRAAEILFAGGIVDTHKSIPAIPALDFSCQPCVGGFPGRLDFHVVHQLLAAGQPGVGGGIPPWGGDPQWFFFFVFFWWWLSPPPYKEREGAPAREKKTTINNGASLIF